MALIVLDTWALMAFFKGEAAGIIVKTFFNRAADEETRLLLNVVNWGEVYYGMWRVGGQEVANASAEDMSRLPLELVEIDLTLARQAAIYKATQKMSYADAFAAALAKLKRAELLTGDPEFKALEKEVKIRWLK